MRVFSKGCCNTGNAVAFLCVAHLCAACYKLRVTISFCVQLTQGAPCDSAHVADVARGSGAFRKRGNHHGSKGALHLLYVCLMWDWKDDHTTSGGSEIWAYYILICTWNRFLCLLRWPTRCARAGWANTFHGCPSAVFQSCAALGSSQLQQSQSVLFSNSALGRPLVAPR